MADVYEKRVPDSGYEMELILKRDDGEDLYQIKEDYIIHESDISEIAIQRSDTKSEKKTMVFCTQ